MENLIFHKKKIVQIYILNYVCTRYIQWNIKKKESIFINDVIVPENI